MIDIYVLNKDLQPIGIIDAYNSLIWSNRYAEIGDCELYLPATVENLQMLKKGYYLKRDDDEMVCQIRRIELDTSAEDGNYLIVNGWDAKSILDQRIIWNTANCNGNVETFVRGLVNSSLISPILSERQMIKENGDPLVSLGAISGLPDVIQQQVSYANVGEKIREYCQKFCWGYSFILSNNQLKFSVYKGQDLSESVIFSDDFENLLATKYIEDDSNIVNVAMIAGEGEGSERARAVSGSGSGVNRYETYVDARDLSRNVTWSELTDTYPGGDVEETEIGWVYVMPVLDIAVIDDNQLADLEEEYPDGEREIISGNLFYRIYSVEIAELPSEEPNNSDTVVLRDVIYLGYLLNRGYEHLAEFGSIVSFEGSIEPNTTFVYKKDYFLGDIVKVRNEYGIEVNARITEVVEVNDENGYSVEPKFEYVEVSEQPVPTGYGLLTESGLNILTEDSRIILE